MQRRVAADVNGIHTYPRRLPGPAEASRPTSDRWPSLHAAACTSESESYNINYMIQIMYLCMYSSNNAENQSA